MAARSPAPIVTRATESASTLRSRRAPAAPAAARRVSRGGGTPRRGLPWTIASHGARGTRGRATRLRQAPPLPVCGSENGASTGECANAS